MIIARKKDIISGFKDESFSIYTVFEFKISKVVNEILKKHEAMLPKEGFFYYSWTP
jgi:hypothetical protein